MDNHLDTVLKNFKNLHRFVNLPNDLQAKTLPIFEPKFINHIVSLAHVAHRLFPKGVTSSDLHFLNTGDARKNLIRIHKFQGGSFGSFFRHLGHSISHIAKSAVHGVEHVAEKGFHGVKSVGKTIGRDVKTGYEDVKHFAQNIGHEVDEGANIAVDFVKSHGRELAAKALPYIEKAVNYGLNAIAPGSGAVLQQAESLANPYLAKEIRGKGYRYNVTYM